MLYEARNTSFLGIKTPAAGGVIQPKEKKKMSIVNTRFSAYSKTAVPGHIWCVPVVGSAALPDADIRIGRETRCTALLCGDKQAAEEVAELVNRRAKRREILKAARRGLEREQCRDWRVWNRVVPAPFAAAVPVLEAYYGTPAEEQHELKLMLADLLEEVGADEAAAQLRSSWRQRQDEIDIKAALDAAGRYRLRRLYGRSYFGSGGCRGYVRCCDNCTTEGYKDNGFVSGPEYVIVLDRTKPAEFTASGGDDIGEGRSWRETATWDPNTQQWV